MKDRSHFGYIPDYFSVVILSWCACVQLDCGSRSLWILEQPETLDDSEIIGKGRWFRLFRQEFCSHQAEINSRRSSGSNIPLLTGR